MVLMTEIHKIKGLAPPLMNSLFSGARHGAQKNS